MPIAEFLRFLTNMLQVNRPRGPNPDKPAIQGGQAGKVRSDLIRGLKFRNPAYSGICSILDI
jgi:hypothetical protein